MVAPRPHARIHVGGQRRHGQGLRGVERQVAHVTQLFQFQVGDGADAMAVLRQLFEQQSFGHIVLSEQTLFALGLDG